MVDVVVRFGGNGVVVYENGRYEAFTSSKSSVSILRTFIRPLAAVDGGGVIGAVGGEDDAVDAGIGFAAA